MGSDYVWIIMVMVMVGIIFNIQYPSQIELLAYIIIIYVNVGDVVM